MCIINCYLVCTQRCDVILSRPRGKKHLSQVTTSRKLLHESSLGRVSKLFLFGSMMLCGCFAALRLERLAINKGNIHFTLPVTPEESVFKYIMIIIYIIF